MTQPVLLGDIADVIMGQSPVASDVNRANSGLPLLNGPTEFGTYHPLPVQFTTNSKRAARKGDLLFCVRGSTTGRMNWAEQDYSIGRGIAAIRHKTNPKLNPYIRGIIETRLSEILASATGSTFPNITAKHLQRIKIDGYSEQGALSASIFINCIDEKTELNRKMNKTLEQMGQALFRHYFIGSPDVEKWEKGNISKLADNIRDGARPPFTESTRYVALEHLTPRTLALYDSTGAGNAASNKTKFKKHDVLFGKLRPYFHKVAVAPFDGVCSTDILAVRPKMETYFSFVSFFMSQKQLIDYATQASEGTRMPRTSWTNICNFTFAMPPDSLLLSFNEKVEPFIEQILANAQEVQTLTTLRDTLLPRLISGKAKV